MPVYRHPKVTFKRRLSLNKIRSVEPDQAKGGPLRSKSSRGTIANAARTTCDHCDLSFKLKVNSRIPRLLPITIQADILVERRWDFAVQRTVEPARNDRPVHAPGDEAFGVGDRHRTICHVHDVVSWLFSTPIRRSLSAMV